MKKTLLSSLFLILLCAQAEDLMAQLDTIHWLPPMHARGEEGPQYLFISTPEKQPFDVTIRDGDGNIITTETIANGQPYQLNLGATTDTKVMVPELALHTVLTGKGLVVDGPKPFYAYFRAHSNSQYQAGDLTCKGRAALGTTFRIGHLLQGFNSSSRRCNFFGIMATEDNTVISISEFEPGTRFRAGGQETTLTAPIQMTLNKGNTIVFAQYSQTTAAAQPVNGFMGTLLTATKPIAVNTGSWTGAPVNFSANDVGIDQIVPVELVGDEYILCRGNGSEILERPIIVAHYDGTQVFVNGNTAPVATLNAGDWIALQTALFSADGNMYLRSSQPIYVYQMVGGISFGDDQYRTAGLIFVPPLSCGIPNTVDEVYLPNRIGAMRFEGGMMITAMRDSAVVLKVDGVVVPTGPAGTVLGNPDFVTYRNLTMFDQSDNPLLVSVTAQGAVQVALFGRNEPASFAGFFSGFTITDRPKLSLSLVGDGVCPDTLEATGNFDGVQWMYEDSILQYGPDSVFIAYAPGQYTAIGYLGVCRRTSLAADSIDAVFNSPTFPFESSDPTCFGFLDGEISIGTPSGGIAPYQYSVDNGQTFNQQPTITGLGAGTYRLVVKDSTGCYNRPELLELGQPDSFGVVLNAINLPDPLFPGGLARFRANPDRPIISSGWEPLDSSGCTDCLDYTLIANQTTWVAITVYDSMGCPATDRILVEVTPNVYAPNVFYPGGTSGNEVFTLLSKDLLPILNMRIYDRWGSLVFEQQNFTTNDLNRGWNGKSTSGKMLDPGVFVWVAEVELTTGRYTVLKGDITLVR